MTLRCTCPDDEHGATIRCPVHGTAATHYPDPRDAEIARLKAEVTEQTARANAEMRAALAALLPLAFPLDGGSDGCGTVGGWKADLLNDTRALLSRTDLGRGMVVVPREVVERWRYAIDALLHHRAHRSSCARCDPVRTVVADLDALLKKGGG